MTRHHAPQGSNSTRTRNRQAVLSLIQKAGEMGRAEIARSLGLTTQAVSNIISALSEEGLLIETGTRSTGRGLPAILYALNPEGAYALGAEIRPNAIFAALLNLKGEVVFEKRLEADASDPQATCATMKSLRYEAMTGAGAQADRLLGAGIVMPGPFGDTGLSGMGTDLPAWRRVQVQPLFQQGLDVPVEVSNDANAAAMAEGLTGVAKGLHSYAYLYCGTGLGLGLVSQGALITGAFGNAGEIGHIPVPVAGGYSSLETVLSRASLSRHLGGQPLSFDQIEQLAQTRDPRLSDWISQAAEALSHAVQIVENLLDPQTIILGGAMPQILLDDLIAATKLPSATVSNRRDATHPRLIAGVTGTMTATRGAAALVLNKTFSP
jgi:predicted NBD/HSP70 family sugar kinase/predicted transcriptional regulator